MSNPVKLRCLDENGGDMFIVSTNTKGSVNASTGALVLNNGGLSINSTVESLSATAGGALTVAGGAAIGSSLRVGSDIHFSGSLYQNGSPFVSGGGGQWTETAGNISYTSGSVVAENLVSTNFSAGNLVASALNLGMSSMFSGSFSASNNVSAATDVSGLAFSADRSSFSGSVMVYIDAATDLYEHFTLSGNRKVSGWDLYVSSQGDISGVVFSITSAGQLQYTSTDVAGFVSGIFRYSFTQLNNSGTYAPVSPSTSGTFIYDTIQISGTQPAQPGTNNGSLYVLGGATIEKNLLVNEGLTVGNLNLTGSLYQNGSPYASSQWTSATDGSISYTSGNTAMTGLTLLPSQTTSALYNLGRNNQGSFPERASFNDSNFFFANANRLQYSGATAKTFQIRFTGTAIKSASGPFYSPGRVTVDIYQEVYGYPIDNFYSLNGLTEANTGFDTGFITVTLEPGESFGIDPYTYMDYGDIDTVTFQYKIEAPPSVTGFSAVNSSNTLGSLVTTTSGNVGIGTGSPVNILSIKGTGGTTATLSFYNSGNPVPYVGLGYDQTSDGLAFYYNGASHVLNSTGMFMNRSGNIGIGTTSPTNRVDISYGIRTGTHATGGPLYITGDIGQSSHGVEIRHSNGTQGIGFGYNSIYATGSNQNIVIIPNGSGKVGIGTVNPSGARLHVDGAASGSPGNSRRYTSSGQDGSSSTWNGISLSLRTSAGIWSTEIFVSSDERIKKNIIDVDDISALNVLRQIEPKRYEYIDTIDKGTTPVWGFIAQQVEGVIDYAVSRGKDYIPNVYAKANVSDSNKLVLLSGDTSKLHLASTDENEKIQLKLITYDSSDNEIVKYVNVESIVDSQTILLEDLLDDTEVFVYGQFVNDFCRLKKDAIFTITTAALQEVDRQLQAEKESHAVTATELQETKAELQSLKTFLQSKFPGEI
jgi:hypothetical protein